MKAHGKVLSIIMGTTMLLSSFAFLSGCKQNTTDRQIKANSTWYDSNTVKCQDAHKDERWMVSNYDYVFAFDDKVYTVFTGIPYVNPEDIMSYDFSTVVDEVQSYDLDGNLLSTSSISAELNGGNYYYCYATKEGITFLCNGFDPELGNIKEYILNYNIADNSFSKPQDIPFDINGASADGMEVSGLDKIVVLSNGALLGSIYTTNGSNVSYMFQVVENGKVVKKVDFKADFNKIIYDFASFVEDDKGNLIAVARTTDGIVKYTMNVGSYDVTEEVVGSASDMSSFIKANDGKAYNIDNAGINALNNKTLQRERALSFSDCNVNLYDMSNLKVLDVKNDRYILAGATKEASGIDNRSVFMISTLTKAKKNPNAGKTRLVIGEVNSYIDASMAEAIYEFNAKSTNYFASIKLYGTGDSINYGSGVSKEDQKLASLNTSASMTNELAVDLMSGNGPDVIINAASYSQLNNSNYLMDLSEYAGKLSPDAYFTNVIDAAKTNNALYQLPLSFVTSGVGCEASYAPANGIGFTLSEYKELVSGLCNGKNPVELNRAMFFLKQITLMSDNFINSDKREVNFKQQSFYDLAEYCRDYVPEKKVTDDNGPDDNDDGQTTDPMPVTYRYMVNLSDFASMNAGGKEMGFYGISFDGRGPAIEVVSSVAVSAGTTCKDGALEFIDILLSENVQYLNSPSISNCINKAALRRVCENSVDSINDQYERQKAYGATEAQLAAWGYGKVDASMIDDYFKCLSTSSTIATVDTSVLLIVIEETSAYFNGQKNIEEVAGIINNRAQTVLNER